MCNGKATFRAYMDEARFWIGAADRLDASGKQSSAGAANNEADYFLGLAEGGLGEMSAVC